MNLVSRTLNLIKIFTNDYPFKFKECSVKFIVNNQKV